MALFAIATWQSIVWYWGLPKGVATHAWDKTFDAALKHRDVLLKGLFSTAIAAVMGLVVAISLGSIISIALSQSKWLRVAIFPVHDPATNSPPIVAVAPLLIIWSGYTFRSVVIVTVIVCLFPIVNSVTAGLTRIDQDMKRSL